MSEGNGDRPTIKRAIGAVVLVRRRIEGEIAKETVQLEKARQAGDEDGVAVIENLICMLRVELDDLK